MQSAPTNVLVTNYTIKRCFFVIGKFAKSNLLSVVALIDTVVIK